MAREGDERNGGEERSGSRRASWSTGRTWALTPGRWEPRGLRAEGDLTLVLDGALWWLLIGGWTRAEGRALGQGAMGRMAGVLEAEPRDLQVRRW